MNDIRPDSAYSWLVAVATLLLASLSFGAANSVPILFPEIVEEFGWGGGRVASLYAVTMAGGAIASLFLGRLLDRVGFFRIGLLATCATCAGIALASIATELWHFYAIYGVLVGGLGQGAFLSTLAAAVSQWFVRNRGLAVAIALSGQGVGGLCVPPLLRALSADGGWREALFTYASLSFLIMCVSIMLFYPTPPRIGRIVSVTRTEASQPPSPLGAQRMRPRYLLPVLFVALWWANSATVGVSSHLVAYGAMAGLTPVMAGTLMSAHYGVVLIARLSAGFWLDRVDHYAVLLVATLIQIAGMVIVWLAGSVTTVVLGAMAIGVGFGGYLPAYGALIQTHYPKEEAGRRMTELYLASFVGAGAGTWMVGALWEYRGGSFDLAFAATLVLSVMALAVLLGARRMLNISADPGPVKVLAEHAGNNL